MSELAIRWLTLGFDASLKALLLALVAAAMLRLLRIRDSNVRHRVWAGVLAGMFLLPALSQFVPALRLPFVPSPERFAALLLPALPTEIADAGAKPTPVENAAAAEPVEAPQVSGDPALAEIEPRFDDEPADVPRDVRAGRAAGFRRMGRWTDGFDALMRDGFGPDAFPPPDEVVANSDAAPPAGEPATVTALAAVETDEPGPPEQSAAATPVFWYPWPLAHAPLLLTAAWLTGALLVTLRLVAGLWGAARLRGAAMLIDAPDLTPLAASASSRPIPLLECPLIRVPVTLGSLHPQILLPPEWIDWPAEKLHAVLTHERTHVERADFAVALLAELNCALYWFHPLAWWLKARLSSLAEEACDDAAIDQTGDRARYARHLLEVASAVSRGRGRVLATGVSMARRSQVETRINSILDFTRPLSRRLTRGATLLLLAAIVPIIALAAALRPLDRQENPLEDSRSQAPDDPRPQAPASSRLGTPRAKLPLRERNERQPKWETLNTRSGASEDRFPSRS